jgi:hypothetical protein
MRSRVIELAKFEIVELVAIKVRQVHSKLSFAQRVYPNPGLSCELLLISVCIENTYGHTDPSCYVIWCLVLQLSGPTD